MRSVAVIAFALAFAFPNFAHAKSHDACQMATLRAGIKEFVVQKSTVAAVREAFDYVRELTHMRARKLEVCEYRSTFQILSPFTAAYDGEDVFAIVMPNAMHSLPQEVLRGIMAHEFAHIYFFQRGVHQPTMFSRREDRITNEMRCDAQAAQWVGKETMIRTMRVFMETLLRNDPDLDLSEGYKRIEALKRLP